MAGNLLQYRASTKEAVELSLGARLYHLVDIALLLGELQLMHDDLFLRKFDQTLAIEHLHEYDGK